MLITIGFNFLGYKLGSVDINLDVKDGLLLGPDPVGTVVKGFSRGWFRRMIA